MPVENIWPLLIANLPLVAAIFWALHKKWVVMGVTHQAEMAEKDKDIAFREQLRQEALLDKAALEKSNRETMTVVGELSTGIKQTLDLNEHLLNEKLDQRWDGYDRRTPKTSTRA